MPRKASLRDASPRDRTKRLGRFSYPPVHPARIYPTSTRDDGRSPGLCVIAAHRLPGTLRWHFDAGSSLTVAGAATASNRVPVSPFKGTIIRRRIIRDEAWHVNIGIEPVRPLQPRRLGRRGARHPHSRPSWHRQRHGTSVFGGLVPWRQWRRWRRRGILIMWRPSTACGATVDLTLRTMSALQRRRACRTRPPR